MPASYIHLITLVIGGDLVTGIEEEGVQIMAELPRGGI